MGPVGSNNEHRPNKPPGLPNLTPQNKNSSQTSPAPGRLPPPVRPRQRACGGVTLVGAGPGDPGLITVAGLDALRHADAVVYDALANPRLLEAVPDHAQLIDAGKRAKTHRLTQDQTNDLLVQLAREGKRVVRLKGGDPYLFGRGAEEVAHLAKHGIACDVIPGITAGVAAPMYAGIPVTHREVASTVTFVTAHEDPTKGRSAVDYQALAQLIAAGGTVCFYMGVGRLPVLSQSLIGHGLDAATPAAAVQWGTLPTQRSVRATLSQLPEAVEAAGLGAPAIIVVGPVAGLNEPGLRFFEQRPLFGKTVLVTRTRQQASGLSRLLEAAGARVIEAPTIRIQPPEDGFAALDQMLSHPTKPRWLILTSANAVEVLAQRLASLGFDARSMAEVKLAVVGQATANAVFEYLRLNPDFVPKRSNGEALAMELAASVALQGQRIGLIRGDLAGEDLPRLLRDAGAAVEQATAYRTTLADQLPESVFEALRDGIDWAAFTSSSCVRNLLTLLGDQRSVIEATPIASIGPRTSEAIRAAGLRVTVQATRPGVESLCEAIMEAVTPGARDA